MKSTTVYHFLRSNFIVLGVSLTLILFSLSSPLRALPALADDQHITLSLMSAGVGDSIRNKCPTISARIFVALRKVKELEKYAKKLGYSEAQIKAFISSKPERERIRGLVRAYMVENGVVEGKKETYCSLGRAEIAKGSLIGQLIWSWK